MLVFQRPWARQPNSPIRVRQKFKPIGGLQPGGFGLLDSTGPAFTVGSGISLGTDAFGRSARFTGAGGLLRTVSVTGYPLSFVFRGYVDVGGAGVYNCLGSIATTADHIVRVLAKDGGFEVQQYDGTNNAVAATSLNVWGFDTLFTCVGVINSSTDTRIYARGTGGSETAANNTNVTSLGTLDKFAIGEYDGSSEAYRLSGGINLAQWLQYGFTDQEALAMLDNPWQLFTPLPRRMWVPQFGAPPAPPVGTLGQFDPELRIAAWF